LYFLSFFSLLVKISYHIKIEDGTQLLTRSSIYNAPMLIGMRRRVSPRANLAVDQNDVPISWEAQDQTKRRRERRMCVFEFKFRILDVTFPPLGEPPGTALVSRRMQFSVSLSFNFLTGSAGDRSRGTSTRRLSPWCLCICICIRDNGDSIPEL